MAWCAAGAAPSALFKNCVRACGRMNRLSTRLIISAKSFPCSLSLPYQPARTSQFDYCRNVKIGDVKPPAKSGGTKKRAVAIVPSLRLFPLYTCLQIWRDLAAFSRYFSLRSCRRRRRGAVVSARNITSWFMHLSALLDSFSASDADGEEKLTSREICSKPPCARAIYFYIMSAVCPRARRTRNNSQTQPEES